MADKFDFYCALTCYGGSEQKECPCLRPTDCELQGDPQYPAAVERAKKRMFNLIRKGMKDEAN